MFPKGDVPLWTVEALQCAGFTVKSTLIAGTKTQIKNGTGIDLGNGIEIGIEIEKGTGTG